MPLSDEQIASLLGDVAMSAGTPDDCIPALDAAIERFKSCECQFILSEPTGVWREIRTARGLIACQPAYQPFCCQCGRRIERKEKPNANTTGA